MVVVAASGNFISEWTQIPITYVILIRVAMGVVTLPRELDTGLVWTHLYGGGPFDA